MSSVFLTNGSSTARKARINVISIPHNWFLTSKQSQIHCHQCYSLMVPHQQEKPESMSTVFLTIGSLPVSKARTIVISVPHQQVKPDFLSSVFLTNGSSPESKARFIVISFFTSHDQQGQNCHQCSSPMVPHQKVKPDSLSSVFFTSHDQQGQNCHQCSSPMVPHQ